MFNRRKFIQALGLGSAGLLTAKQGWAGAGSPVKGQAVVLSTWAPNVKANAKAWEILSQNGRALDAVVAGVQVPEADPSDNSVGYGGLPDRDGRVTLDSCVMDEKGNCGAVMALEHIMHPVKVARLVMEKTPHVQLVGEGALQFALAQGFEKQNLLTPESEKAWQDWIRTNKYDPMRSVRELEEKIKREQSPGSGSLPWPAALLNHDTIGMVALDQGGQLSGACTTSGMAFKMHGRVGDSPIIGAGLYVDNEVGAATATGVGEEVVRICGAHTVVEAMRRGMSPEQACREAVRRIVKRRGAAARELQVGFIALNNRGQVGGFALQPNFTYCVTRQTGTRVAEARCWFPAEKKG